MYPPSVECNRIFTKGVTVIFKTKLKVNNLNATYLDQNVLVCKEHFCITFCMSIHWRILLITKHAHVFHVLLEKLLASLLLFFDLLNCNI